MAKSIISDPEIRADHRFIKKLCPLVLKKQPKISQKALDRMNDVFYQKGGSWRKVFLGSVKDVELLKKIVKAAGKVGILG